MIEEPKLIRIKRNTPRPTAAQIAALGSVPTGVVNDALWGRGALHKDIKPVDSYGQMDAHAVGAALTVETGPADILALLASLAYIQSGDIVVQSFGAHQGCAAAGVTTLKVGLDGAGPLGPARFEALERFMDLIKDNA